MSGPDIKVHVNIKFLTNSLYRYDFLLGHQQLISFLLFAFLLCTINKKQSAIIQEICLPSTSTTCKQGRPMDLKWGGGVGCTNTTLNYK